MAKVFFSYSHKDELLRDALDVHLTMLKRQGLIETVHDRRIVAGDDLDQAIDAYLESADVILCLVSPDFIASEYCYSREMGRALERHQAGEARVIPVILRYCEWQETPLKGLLATPTDGKPVRAWPDQDEALNNVTAEIRRAVRAKPGPAPHAPVSPDLRRTDPAPMDIKPRSANLQVRRKLTDKDRDDHLEHAFEFAAEYFALSLAELERRQPEISVKFSRLDARRFTASAYREGKKVSAISVFIGGAFGSNGIGYNNDDRGVTNSTNGSFHLPDRGDELRFKSLFGSASGSDVSLDYEGVAEAIWASFMDPLQR